MYDLDATLIAALASGAPTMMLRLTHLADDLEELQRYEVTPRPGPGQVVIGGSASAEVARDVRRQASLELASQRVASELLEQGAAVRVEVGALVASGPIYVPMVTGFVTAGRRYRNGQASLTIEAFLSACRQQAGTAFNIPAGSTLPVALHALWDPVLPFVEWVIDDTAAERTLGADVPVLPTDVRLDVGLRLARAVGCEAFDDRLGRLVVRARPDPFTQEVARTVEFPLELDRGFSRPPVNAQPVEASPGDGEPFYVLEEITDPAHPWHKDRIGLRMAPMIRSDTIPDPDAARALARSWLAGRMLRADDLSASWPVSNLDMDEGDVVAREDAVTGTAGRYIIESISYPLGMGTISTSERVVLPMFLTEEGEV